MPILLPLIASLLLHGAAVALPGWDLPGLSDPEPAAIDARLAPLPPPAVTSPVLSVPSTPVKAKPAPRPAAKRLATATPDIHPVIAADTPAPPASAPQPAAPPAQPEPPVETVASAPAAPPPPAVPFARQGRVRYVASYGDGGFVIGETVHEWRIEGDRYQLRSLFEPKGLAALRGKKREQSSSGEVTAAGLRPHEFRDQREGREAEAASFDWPAGKVVFSGGRGDAHLAADGQDLLSVFYQLAWLAPRHDVELAVVTAGRIGRSGFEWLGEERIELAGGPVAALHLRTRSGGDTTEVWLAPRLGGLPVKIRYTDRKGDVFDQVADTLELD